MKDEVLGTLIPDEDLPNILVGAIEWEERQIGLRITPDSDPLETCIQLARDAAADLSRISAATKRAASENLLSTYNDHWREYQEQNDAGEWVLVSNPILSAGDFEARLTLRTLEIVGSDSLSIWFDDGDLFNGHSIFVDSEDGLECKKLTANLFG